MGNVLRIWPRVHSGAQWGVTSPRRRVVAAAAAALGLLAMFGTSTSAEAAGGSSALKVTVSWSPGLTDTWTLTCDPVGGSHPNRVRACAFLDRLAAPFATPPTGLACTMIYSGPERARVVGTWRGKRVDTRFARNDGCATARWQKYAALFTERGVVTVRGRVDLGPTCPVQRPGDNCEIVGAPATVTATSGARQRVIPSGVDGFAARLPRAVWTFTADAGMSCPEVMADARQGHTPPPIVISCDTGIR